MPPSYGSVNTLVPLLWSSRLQKLVHLETQKHRERPAANCSSKKIGKASNIRLYFQKWVNGEQQKNWTGGIIEIDKNTTEGGEIKEE